MARIPGEAVRHASRGLQMKKKVAVGIAALASAVAMLVPASSRAATPKCVVINGPHGLHIQVGYAPNGPQDCKVL